MDRLSGHHLAQTLAVVCQCRQCPFGFDVFKAAQVEAGEVEDGFDDAEDGFDSLFSFSVLFSGRFGLQFVDHTETPLRGYGLGRGPEVIGAFMLLA
jgi:hypothetical protein